MDSNEFHLHLHDGVSPEAVTAAIKTWGQIRPQALIDEPDSDLKPEEELEAEPEQDPEALAKLARRAYKESDGNMGPLLEFLAKNEERWIPFVEASEALGFKTARSMPGLLGAFGRRANHRYGGKWPFETAYRDGGAAFMRIEAPAAAALREVIGE